MFELELVERQKLCCWLLITIMKEHGIADLVHIPKSRLSRFMIYRWYVRIITVYGFDKNCGPYYEYYQCCTLISLSVPCCVLYATTPMRRDVWLQGAARIYASNSSTSAVSVTYRVNAVGVLCIQTLCSTLCHNPLQPVINPSNSMQHTAGLVKL